jgi:nucleoid DNA-binding protein
MTYEEMISRVASSTGLSKALVNRTYKTYWRTVKEYIESLPLKQDLTEEEFKELKPNVNIPSLGKFYVTLGGYKRIKHKINN